MPQKREAEIVMVFGSSDAGNVSPSTSSIFLAPPSSIFLIPPASLLLASEAQVAFGRNYTTARAKKLCGDCTVEVTFWNANPPGVSYYTLRVEDAVCDDFDLDELPPPSVDLDNPPSVVGAQGRSVLIKVLFSSDCEYEYFMYKGHLEFPSLENIPLPDKGYSFRGVEEFAIVPRCDDGHYLLIALCDDNEKVGDYLLRIYSSENALWKTKQLLNPCPGHGNLIVPEKVFVLPDGLLLWVDLLRGILVCDIDQEQPHARYIPLPGPLPGNTGKVLSFLPRVRQFRDLTCVDGLIKFIEMEHREMVTEIPEVSPPQKLIDHRTNDVLYDSEIPEDSPPEKLIDHRTTDVLYDSDLMTQPKCKPLENKTRLEYSVDGWSAITWTRVIGSNCWFKRSIVDVDDISVDGSLFSALLSHKTEPAGSLTLKNLYLAWPTLSTDGNDILYLKSHSKFGGALLAVDLAKKKALKMEGPRMHPSGNYLYLSQWNTLRPCALANHLKLTAYQMALMRSVGICSFANEQNNTAIHVGETDSCESQNKRPRLSAEEVNHARNGAQSTVQNVLISQAHPNQKNTVAPHPCLNDCYGATKGIHSNTLRATHIPMVPTHQAAPTTISSDPAAAQQPLGVVWASCGKA